MAARAEPLLQHIRRLASRTNPAPDADLLTRFLETHDEAAFTALVNRHGPMVLGVCRRILGDDSDAEDAFQATFLTLARKAAAIRPADSLPAWLYGVARHLAMKVRRSRDRRLRREGAGARTHDARPQQGLLDQLTGREVLEIVDEELQRLPEVYRLPLILCYLEGHGHDEAARRLGWSLGSFRGRLERGRARLQTRLVRRGLALGTTLLLWDLLRRGTTAAVPPALMQATVQTAVRLAAGDGVLSQVAVLAERVTKTLFVTKVKTTVVLLGVVAAVAMGGALARQAQPAPAGEPKHAAETPAGPRVAEKSPLRTDRYGDLLPSGALARLGTVRLRQEAGLQSLAFTRDGKGLITAGGKKDPVRLWDVATGRLLRQFGGGGDRIYCTAALSPDGRTLAGSVGSAGDLGLWDVATGTLLRRLKGGQVGETGLLAFSPDGKTVAAAYGTLRLWEVATGKELWAAADRLHVDLLTYSADSKALIWSGPLGDLHLWDAVEGKELRRWDDEKKRPISALVCAPNGLLFTAHPLVNRPGEARSFARLWDVATGKEVWHQTVEEAIITAAAFSPDGKVLGTRCLCLRGGPLRLWDAATGKELRRCDGGDGRDYVRSLAFSPDGKTLASGVQAVNLWDVSSGREVRHAFVGHEYDVCSVTFTPDGKDIISISEDSLRVWDAATGQQRRQVAPVGGEYFAVGRCGVTHGVSPNGKPLLSATWDLSESKSQVKVRRWDRDTGRELPGWSREVDGACSLIISPDGKTVACTLWKAIPKPVRRWEAATGKELRPVIFGGHPAFSPDGKLLATAPAHLKKEEPGSFSLWEAATGKELCSIPVPEGHVHRLLFSSDGRMLATASASNERDSNEPSVIHLWPLLRNESQNLGVLVGPPRLLDAEIPSFGFRVWTFSPDGRTLAFSDTDGTTIQLVETASGKERGRFAGHGGNIETLAFAPDGRRLASGSRDTTILVWDATGRLQDGRLRPAQLSDKELAKLWADLAADDGKQAGRAIWTLVAAPTQSVPYLRERLRTLAADAKVQLTKVPQLLRDLDDDRFAVRNNAQRQLKRLGAVVEPALRQALSKKGLSLEVRRRLEQLLKAREVERQAPSGESLRGVRALEVLEQIATREVREALQSLTPGTTESYLTHEAHIALERLERAQRR